MIDRLTERLKSVRRRAVAQCATGVTIGVATYVLTAPFLPLGWILLPGIGPIFPLFDSELLDRAHVNVRNGEQVRVRIPLPLGGESALSSRGQVTYRLCRSNDPGPSDRSEVLPCLAALSLAGFAGCRVEDGYPGAADSTPHEGRCEQLAHRSWSDLAASPRVDDLNPCMDVVLSVPYWSHGADSSTRQVRTFQVPYVPVSPLDVANVDYSLNAGAMSTDDYALNGHDAVRQGVPLHLLTSSHLDFAAGAASLDHTGRWGFFRVLRSSTVVRVRQALLSNVEEQCGRADRWEAQRTDPASGLARLEFLLRPYVPTTDRAGVMVEIGTGFPSLRFVAAPARLLEAAEDHGPN
jgi:hypothetical protein